MRLNGRGGTAQSLFPDSAGSASFRREAVMCANAAHLTNKVSLYSFWLRDKLLLDDVAFDHLHKVEACLQ
jgi:hypothetical protein